MTKGSLTGIHPVDVHVGKMLKQKRLERGISQDDLAGSVNLTFQQVQKYEKGINRVSSSKLYDFAKFLKVDIKYFFDGLDDYKFSSHEQSYAADKASDEGFVVDVRSKEIKSLVSAFSNISDLEVRKNILLLVKKLTS
jgi:transcriptional regulator with XRE-family HTH domain